MAARLRGAGETDVAVVDPATTHYYQPLWALVGGGCSTIAKSARPQADVMPQGVQWVRPPSIRTAGRSPWATAARSPEVFALGDAGSTPNSKTGAAIRKQAPVAVENLRAVMAGKTPSASHGGYASCPLTTAGNKMPLAEVDYTMQPTPSIPFIDTTKERKDMWLLKKYGLPALYWNLMLTGRA